MSYVLSTIHEGQKVYWNGFLPNEKQPWFTLKLNEATVLMTRKRAAQARESFYSSNPVIRRAVGKLVFRIEEL